MFLFLLLLLLLVVVVVVIYRSTSINVSLDRLRAPPSGGKTAVVIVDGITIFIAIILLA